MACMHLPGVTCDNCDHRHYPQNVPQSPIYTENPHASYQRGYDDGFRAGYEMAKKELDND